MNKRKILFFVPLPPPIHGPALRNKSLIESDLITNSFELIILPFDFAVETNDIGKFSFNKVLKAIIRTFDILLILIKKRPNLVYLNPSLYGFALYRDCFYILIFKLFGTKLLFHLRTQGVKDQVVKSQFKKYLFDWMFKKVSVICLSNKLCEDIAEAYKGNPIVVPNGIEDVSKQYPKQIRNQVISILFLSNLVRSKGIFDLLEALKIVAEKHKNFECLIVGHSVDISFEELDLQIERLGIAKYVRVFGPKYDQEKYRILADTDILVFPTYFEAFPGIILEAMQFEIPVISTYEGAIPEIVVDKVTGFLVAKRDISSLAKKIAILIESEELRLSLGRRARERFENLYTMSHFESNMKMVFDKILNA